MRHAELDSAPRAKHHNISKYKSLQKLFFYQPSTLDTESSSARLSNNLLHPMLNQVQQD